MECPYTFSSEFAFEVHMQNDHGPKKNSPHPTSFSCAACGMIFADEHDLKGHNERQHENQMSTDMSKSFVKCPSCTVELAGEADLEVHIRAVHEQIEQEVIKEALKCDKCTFTSTSEVIFRQHILTAHVPGFSCHECKTIIKPKDLVVGCSECELFYHGWKFYPQTWAPPLIRVPMARSSH